MVTLRESGLPAMLRWRAGLDKTLGITSMTRVIEVSHWGNIAVEENVDLKHTGAVLKGPFSRYDYQRQPDSGVSSVRSFKVWADGPGHWETL